MYFKNLNVDALVRISQILVALIPFGIGVFALLNDTADFSNTLHSVVTPLITMTGVNFGHWRSLPGYWSSSIYILMFLSEFLVGILASVGIFLMLKNMHKDQLSFENAKKWIYLSCGWGIFIWGMCFFEIGGDWFLSWQSADVKGFQQDGLYYALELLMTFIYLKLSFKKND